MAKQRVSIDGDPLGPEEMDPEGNELGADPLMGTKREEWRKAITAGIGAVVTVVGIALNSEIDIEPELIAAITTILTTLAVWWRPNGP